jgi:nucleotide-binding universal stress UspA family protein
MILVSYDGSADAQAAIDLAARLMPGAEATVLIVWEPFVEFMTRTGAMGLGFGPGYGDVTEIDASSRDAALLLATEGAERATAAGLVAKPRCETLQDAIATTVLSVAADIDADLVVVGTRGLNAVKSLLLGSVSHAIVQHADRAILVAPSPALAATRHEWVTEHAVVTS